jgi:aldehyde:ferredoxin oxidoreductase
MDWHGYQGKYLRVNLTEGSAKVEELEKEFAETYLGGNGFGAKILHDEVGPDVEPLSSENKLIFSSGPLVGTQFPSSARGEVVSKSPLTGIYGDSNVGGMFPAFLKMSGFDMVIVEGKASRPVYLHLEDGEAELNPAKDLWGLDALETEKELQDTHGKATKVASIGQAGENLVRFACIMASPSRSFGRTGMGAVMGFKNLKAISAYGTNRPSLANPDKFKEVAAEMRERVTNNEVFPTLETYGTPSLVPLMNEIGRFPTKNFQYGSFDEAEKIGPERLHEDYWVEDMGCFGCPVQCDNLYRVEEGEFAGTEISSVEYETLSALGSGVMNSNLASILKGNELCDRLGMDTISTGRTISMAMELYEEGILDKEDADNTDLEWGDYNTVLELIKKIARRDGFGDTLADGVKRMADSIGKDAEEYAMHVKGQEIAAQDGRAQQSMGLAHVTSTRGADHLKGFPVIDETGNPEEAERRYGEDYLPEMANPQATKHKPLLVKDGEDFGVVIDSSGLCKSAGSFVLAEIYWDAVSDGITYATGLNFSKAKLKDIGERIYNLMRIYNSKHGIDSEDDILPERFLEEESPSGRAEGNVCRLDEMIDEYYELRGWDKETGLPTDETLERLGLEELRPEV